MSRRSQAASRQPKQLRRLERPSEPRRSNTLRQALNPRAVLVFVLAGLGRAAGAEPGDLIAFLPAGFNAPADLTYDEVEGTYWTISYTKDPIFVRSHDLKTAVRTVPLPIEADELGSRNTGIAYDAVDDTFWISNNFFLAQIYEVRRDGSPTGRVIYPPAPDEEAGCGGLPGFAVLGLAFDPQGDHGAGSIYAVVKYNGVALIDELALTGALIRSFPDLGDKDRFIGKDCDGTVGDVELIREDGRLIGLYAVATWGGLPYVAMRLDLDGRYTGVSVSLASVGGIVGGLLRRSFPDPASGEEKDSFVATASNSSRFAILQGGEPRFREVTDLECAAIGRSLDLTWTRGQVYDSIEVLRSCEVLEVLPGTADRWDHEAGGDGVYELSLRARRGIEFQVTEPCRAVVGAGQVLQSVSLEVKDEGQTQVMDLGWDGRDTLVITDSRGRRLLFYDLDLQPKGYHFFLDETFFAWDDRIGGIAYGGEPGTVFLHNKTQSRIARMETSGTILGSFAVTVPQSPKDLETGKDTRDVRGMTYDPRGDGGKGSLWLVEDGRGYLYEIDLQGSILREVPHPYLDDPGLWEKGGPSGVDLNGIDVVPGADPRQAYLSGVIGEPLASCGIGQEAPLIFRFDLEAGKVLPGSTVSAAALGDRYCLGHLSIQCVPREGEPARLYVLHGYAGVLLRLEDRSPAVFPPELLSTKASKEGDVEVRFTPGEAYEAVEVFRDCARTSVLPGDTTSFVDSRPGSGFHEYAVRGIKGGSPSELRRSRLRVGPGAVLQREKGAWPPKGARQIARDPVDGTFYGVDYLGVEVHHFDRDLRYLDGFPAAVESPWNCRTLALRARPGEERLLYFITESGMNGNSFRLMSERLGGGLVDRVEISPPQPEGLLYRQPWGLAWDPASDTFFYQERNSNTFVEMDPSGKTLRTFPHPSPPVSFFVNDLGLTVVPTRGTLFVTGSNPLDLDVSRVLEMRLDGTLTGYEIPLARSESGFVAQGIAFVEPDELIVTQGERLVRVQAFEAGYRPAFVRGDPNGDQAVDLSDVVFILSALFTGGPPAECADAADADDSGVLDITDAIYDLLYLFLGGDPPPEPFPAEGADPTQDPLPCR